MRRIELEILALRAVEDMRAGRQREDDRVEVKSRWPEPKAARQMAGAANALRGEPLVYIIGCDEAGAITDGSGHDPESWYREICREFNSPPPRLLFHVTVAVTDTPGDSVTALAFDTNEFPYVMTVKSAPDRREVPLRTATGTKSSDRQDLLRILAPTLTSPPCEISDAEVSASISALGGEPGAGDLSSEVPPRTVLSISARLKILINFVGDGAVSAPIRSIRVRVRTVDGETWDLEPYVMSSAGRRGDSPAPPPPRFGVHVSGGFVIATGVGEFSLQASGATSAPPATEETLEAHRALLLAADSLIVDVRLFFASGDRPTVLHSKLLYVESRPLVGIDRMRRVWATEAPAIEW
ncbi:hypothetical protein GCM10009737_10920 [Nocardioides lentus]|uniref:Schlafen AlbA-2 domain-containing protein n=1 Tax=Nocardioides lentus TaxID=338077 RepID=A0ABP5ADQ8_9ACTN